MGLFDLAEVRLADLEARLAALESAIDYTNGDWYWIDRDTYGGPGGCVADGNTDNTTAFKAVLAAAASAGKYVYVPPAALPYLTNTVSGTTYPAKVHGAFTDANPRPTAWTSKLKFIASATGSMFSLSGRTDLEFKYLDIDGNAANQTANRSIFYISGGSHHITVQGCYIHDCGRDTEGGLGVAGDNSSYVYVKDCTFHATANDVEPMSGCHHWTIDNNRSSDSIAESIVAYLSDNHTITNNIIIRAGSYGISINNGDGSVLRGNRFENCKCAIEIRGDGGGAVGNTVEGNVAVGGAYSTLPGIQAWGAKATGTIISGNSVTGWKNRGFCCYSGATGTYTGNTSGNNAQADSWGAMIPL